MDELKIEHTHEGDEGAWFIVLDGHRVGEMVYEDNGPDLITIIHTQVGEELKGRGAGKKLVEAAVAWARENHKKVIAECPFTKSTIAKNRELQDVLAT